jgi:AcrR family transcriptional regulator
VALVHKYFGTKGALYLEVVRAAAEGLLASQLEADATLGSDASVGRRVARSVEVYLDFVASAPEGWAAPLRSPHEGFPEAAALRAKARARYVEMLRAVLGLSLSPATDQVLYGYLGYVDSACLAWATAGCVAGERAALVRGCLGALYGALEALDTPGTAA